MKNENKFIYYGIIFYYLYFQIYGIFSEIFFSLVLIFRWSVHFIPLFLLLLVAILSILFYRIKKFPTIRIWYIFIALFFSSLAIVFSSHAILSSWSEDSQYSLYYSTEIRPNIRDYTIICGVVNTIVFLCISYFKYVNMQKNDQFQSYADDALKMKNENKLSYYGILFHYLYIELYYILSEGLLLAVLGFRWNIYLIPVLFILLTAIFSILFYRIKKFPGIRFWFFFIVVVLSYARTYFDLPYRLNLLGENSQYNDKIQFTILNYIYYCRIFNTLVFLIITCFKYVKMQRNDRFKSYADNVEQIVDEH